MKYIIQFVLCFLTIPVFGLNNNWNVSDKERTCLYLNAFFEGSTDTITAHQGFIEVVLNRRSDPEYPNNACQVIYQSDAFSWTIGKDENFSWAQRDRWIHENEKHVLILMHVIVDGILEKLQKGELKPITFGATHYHANYVKPCWLPDMRLTNKLGQHLFYMEVQKTGACKKAINDD